MDAGSGKTPSSVPRNLALIIFSFFLYHSDAFASFIEWAFNASATSSAFLLHFPFEDVGTSYSWRKVCNLTATFDAESIVDSSHLPSSDVANDYSICFRRNYDFILKKKDTNPKKPCHFKDINNQSSIRMKFQEPRFGVEVLLPVPHAEIYRNWAINCF